jgi:phenylacetate-CoA ligase
MVLERLARNIAVDTDPPWVGRWHDPDEVAGLQAMELERLLQQAGRSPFYRARLDDAELRPDAFSKIPFTTKEDLRDAYPLGMLAVPREEVATYHESSGSTGRPTPSYYTEDDWSDLAERFARKTVDMCASDTFLVRTPYALLITGHLGQAAARLRGATVVPADNRSLAMPYARVIRLLKDLDVSITWSLPTEILLWTRAAQNAGLDPSTDFPALRAFYTGGEPFSRPRRDRISRIWRTPVVEEYGSTETGPIAGVCPLDRMHVWADRFICEVYDPATGMCSPTGRGQLIVTPLRRQAMPLLRYNLEDIVEVRNDRCPCGWAFPVIAVYGRAGFTHRVRDAEFTQSDLEELVFSLPDEHDVLFWRARAHEHQLDVQIEAAPENAKAACALLQESIETRLGVPASVEAIAPGTLVPPSLFATSPDVVKPKALFAVDEDWDKAIQYW